MNVKEHIKTLAEEYFEDIVHLRRYIHENPELSFHEYKTSALVKEKLREYGIDTITEGIAETGLLAVIEGTRGPTGKTIALRADMDALPINEANDVVYKSKYEGIMHACGHDVHTASLLGAARILNQLKTEFAGRILLIFQPGEELLPGGARLMLEKGIFDHYQPEAIIAQHVLPDMDAGTVGFKNGMYMASSDEIYLTVKGKGGHAALPHLVKDTVLMAAQIIISLQQIASRNANPAVPTVLSFGKVEANGATNVIPDTVEISGTFRTMNEEWRAEAHQRIKQIAQSVATAMGGSCEVKIVKGYPFLVNDESVTAEAKKASIEYLGNSNVVDMDIRMTAEDFSYFSQSYPSTLFRLGVKKPDSDTIRLLHTSTFDIDEQAIKTSIGNLSWIAMSYLRSI
jgi:amidohydrolase